MLNVRFRNPQDAGGATDLNHLRKQLGPIPGPHKTDPIAQIDEMKGGSWKVQPHECIHDLESDTMAEMLCLGLCTGGLDHAGANVNPCDLYLRKILGDGSGPSASSTAHIQDSMHTAHTGLFRQGSSHRLRGQFVL